LYWGSVNLVTKEKLAVSESPYIISITAYDGLIGMRDTLKSRKILKVYVLNKGNGQPVDYYSIHLYEERMPIIQVVTIQAVIPNLFKDEKKLNEILCSIETNNNTDNNPYYKIDSVTGLITTTQVSLDYEEKDPIKRQQIRNIKVRATS
jgi:hypothetical protein